MTAAIFTAQLQLRPLMASDAGALHGIFGDPQAMAFWDTPALSDAGYTASMIARQCAEQEAGSHCYWTARHRDAADVVGAFDLSDIAVPAAEVGFIVAPRYWHRGLAREAVAAVMAWGTASLRLARFTARIHVGNQASAALLMALGFRQTARLAAAVVRDGRPRDCLIFERRV